MTKKELKLEFEKGFNSIKVSKELRVKTLSAIQNQNNVFHFPYWIKNCVAVFIVTCLCLSIWVINNKNLFNSNQYNLQSIKEPANEGLEEIPEKAFYDATIESEKTSNTKMRSFMAPSMSKTGNSSTSSITNDIIKEEITDEDMMLNSLNYSLTKDYTDINIGLSEEEFLSIYPDAEKVENGYILIIDGIKTLYKVHDKIICEIILQK